MLKLDTPRALGTPGFLRRLRKYSANELLINNAYRQLFIDIPSWSTWIEETFTELLQVPSGNELHITLRNELDSQQTQGLVFTQREISVGRAAENDISLPLQSISRHHARIIERDGNFFIQDMRSVSGTYLNRRKLDPDHPCRLGSGDEVLMFPYTLQIEPKDLWRPDDSVRVAHSSERVLLDAREFASRFGPETCLFKIGVHPGLPYILLAISRPLAKVIIARLLRSPDTSLVESDRELLEFIVACVLERANRAIRFPFECSFTAFSQGDALHEAGMELSAYVTLSDARGWMRAFVPDSLLKKAPPLRQSLPAWMKSVLKWRLPLRIGYADLQIQDIKQMERGDIVLYTATCHLVLPTQPGISTQRGWHIARDANSANRFSVQYFQEWSAAMPADDMHEDTNTDIEVPDLSTLPVRMHVVLARVDMDLDSLERLTAGSIIQLDADTSGTVQLVVGETVLGTGDLVELEGERLGVHITQWRER